MTTWDERNRFLVAVIDQINKIDEVNENNNWDIERLLSTDLEISKKVARIQPLRIDANFETNRDSLNRAGRRELLKQPLDELKLALDALDFQNTYLEIGGHTDERGPAAYNNDLSFRRAKWIKNFLITQFNFDSTRISAIGYGESNPLHDSVGFKYAKFSPEWVARHKDNRRIELRWLQNETGIAPPDTICNSPECVANNPTVRAAFVGQKIEYQLSVKNPSTNDADRVKITDVLPQYFRLVNGSVNSTINTAFATRWDTLTWIADIAAGDSAVFNYTAEITENFVNMIQKLENKARVSAQLDYNITNNSDSTSITGIGNIVSDSQTKQQDDNVHIVRCGEYLSTIALMYYGNAARYDTISKANNISDPNRIEAGDRLKIPAAKIASNIAPDSVYVDIVGDTKVGGQLRAYLRYKKNNRIVPYNVSYNWLRNDAEIPNEDCATYQVKSLDSNQKLTVEIIVDEAKGLIFSGDLQSIVENQPPLVSNVNIEGSRCVEGVLYGTYDYDDPEDDQDRSQFKWFRNDQIIETSTQSKYTVTTKDVGATLKFAVVPSDGFSEGSAIFSPEVLIPIRVEDEADCEIAAPISVSQN